MKCTFLKLKNNTSLISYIHYLHLEAFEFYNIPMIACSKVLTYDCFVWLLKELISLTDFWSSVEASSLPNLSALFPAFSLQVPPRVYHLILKSFLFVLALFDNFCQGVSLSELPLSLSSELEFTRAAYMTLYAGLPILSCDISQSSSCKCFAWTFVIVSSNWFLRWNVTGVVFSIIL